MKNHLLTLLFTSLSFTLFGQIIGYNSINPNLIKAGVHANGSMFMDEDGVNLGFFTPYFDGFPEIGTIRSAGLWMSALDSNGNLKVTTAQYAGQLNGNAAYNPGPYNADAINFNFNQVWKVSGVDIRAHLADLADGQIDNAVPQSLRDWPGKGNELFALPSDQDLAPFFDYDMDGIYSPQNGDYPVIGNDLLDLVPEEMIYTVVSDDGPGIQNPLGVEIHTVMYGLNCTNSEVLQNTLFARHRVISKAVENLNDFKFSLWMDPDLGCFEDDMMGCDTTRNAFYIYNEDAEDGGVGFSCQGGINTYANRPPVQSVVTLNQKMDNFSYALNCAIGAPHPAQCDPIQPNEIRNAMNSLWRDGTPLTVGNDGYNVASQATTNYAFFDPPSDPNGWSMLSEDLPHYDFKILSSSGTSTLQPSQMFTIDYAYIFTQRSGADNIENVDFALEDIDAIQAIYDNSFTAECIIINSTANIKSTDKITIYPNPATGIFNIDEATNFNQYRIMDEHGKELKRGKITNGRATIAMDASNGIYFLIMSGDKQMVVKKLMVL